MTFVPIEITSLGGAFNNLAGGSTPVNVRVFTSGSVTLAGNVTIIPSTAISGMSFSIRWEAEVTLSTFSVTICGVTINQDQVNQTGTFDCYYDGSAWSVLYYADGTDLPQEAQGVTSVVVPTSGTLTLVAGVDTKNQRLVGSPTTLVAGYNVTASTSGVKAGSTFVIDVAGGVTIGANAFTVFGLTISAAQALNGGVSVTATFDGTVWRAVQSSLPVNATDLTAQAALSVIANATNASASPTAFAFGTDGGVLQRSGTSLVASLLTEANFNAKTFPLKYEAIPISSPEILTGFASPVTILAGVAGKINIPILVVWETTYNAATYAANLNALITTNGKSTPVIQQNGLLGFTSSGYAVTSVLAGGVYQDRLAVNTALEFSVGTGNPTVGDGTITIHLFYVQL